MLDKQYLLLGRIPDDDEELSAAVSAGKEIFYFEELEADDDWYYQARRITPEEFDQLNSNGRLEPWDFIIDPIIIKLGKECTIPKGSYEFKYATKVVR